MPKRAQTSKAAVIDRVSGRLVTAGEEEINATQPLLEMLIDELGWLPEQIVSRPQWRVPASPSTTRKWPVDVAIFTSAVGRADPEQIRIICECKKPDEESGIGQLKIYLDREPHARLGIWFNGTDYRLIYKSAEDYEIAPVGTPIPRPTDPLTPVTKVQRLITDLEPVRSLRPVLKRIRDRVAGQDTHVNRDEEMLPDITNLLLLKMQDEYDRKTEPKRPLSFQLLDDDHSTTEHMLKLLGEQIRNHPDTFVDAQARFALDEHSVAYIVREMQNIRMLGNNDQLILEAFEYLRGKSARGEEGQFNTPSPAVKMAIAALDPEPYERFCDLACGAGSFGAQGLERVVEKLAADSDIAEADRILFRDAWVRDKLYLLDKDAVSVRLAKAQLGLLAGGRPANVFKVDSLQPNKWPDHVKQHVADQSFKVIATNPPFGTALRVSKEVARAQRYEVCLDWKYDRVSASWKNTGRYVERDIGIVFLERALRLLEEGGRMAIVLPDTYLFSDKYGWLLQWLGQYRITHTLGVPIELFEPSCRAKTSVLVLRKERPPTNNVIIGACNETFGQDKHGKVRYRFEGERMTSVVDDDMGETAQHLLNPPSEPHRLHFAFRQDDAFDRRVLVASYWWRTPVMEALEKFAADYDCDLVNVGQLIEDGELQVLSGHGSPSSHVTGKGRIAYVKVTDIKDERVNFNPMYAIPSEIADKMRGVKRLQPFDLLMPTRASKNIGMFGVLMPWQTDYILTREIAIWRVPGSAKRVDWATLLTLSNMRVVFDQYRHLVLFQMNREDLNDRYLEVVLPIPRDPKVREAWFGPTRHEVEAIAEARRARMERANVLPADAFVGRS